MKKSKLMQENMQLYNRLDAALKQVSVLETELKSLRENFETMRKENESLRQAAQEKHEEEAVPESVNVPAAVTPQTQPEIPPAVEEFMPQFPKNQLPDLEEDMQYAADTIGQIVIESAKFSNRLAEGGRPADKELVNLVLGKTEVSKAEILGIARQDMPIDVKKQKIDAVKALTLEYFESVEAQKA